VADTAIDTLADRRVPPFAGTAVVTILQCLASTLGNDDLFGEVYMLAIGRNHLDWGSVDQPPVVPRWPY